jgi:hemerythrin-like domain-containing protein
MAVQIGSLGQPGFDSPFALMSDCHRRIEHFLGIFRRVVDEYASKLLDDEAKKALVAAVRYFRESAPNHTADEEDSLFPRLRSLEQEELEDLLVEAERLERDHDQAEKIHGSVEELVHRWLESGSLEEDDINQLRSDLDALSALYSRHIHFEDCVLFPRAKKVLSRAEVRDIGLEMAARRGV